MLLAVECKVPIIGEEMSKRQPMRNIAAHQQRQKERFYALRDAIDVLDVDKVQATLEEGRLNLNCKSYLAPQFILHSFPDALEY